MADTINIALRRTSGASDESNTSDAFDSLPSSVTTDPSSITSSPSKPVRKRTISTGGSGDTVIRTSNRTIYTAGRPPWYNSQGQLHEAFVIGLCGGSASGKTTVANEIIKALDVPWVSLLSMDSFYKVLSPKQHEQANRNEYNFDHPDAFDFELLVETLKKLKEGKHVEVPVYNFTTHSREREMKTMYGANVVIFEGIMAFAKKELIDVMDLKIFVDTDSDIRLARRLKRDITDRGRGLEGVIKQYNKFVKPAFEQFIEPSIQHADIVVPRGAENEVAMILIVQHVHDQLTLRGFQFRAELPLAHVNQPLPDTLYVVTNTVQVQGLHTFIRNRDTGRDEFIFYSQRLTRILIEYALSLLPFEDCIVETPQNTKYAGKRFKGRSSDGKNKICGVSILRAGEVMEPALSEVCKDIRLGKILIQTNNISGEPELHYLRLPKDIKKDYVILMDATVATGAAAMMAIRVLLDHDVPQENILFLSLLVAESGVQTVAYAFPKVKIVTTAVDKAVNENFHILPGIGNFGDRYFGTGS
ncbi:uridine-cytidine kinase-like 1 isoform X2 [Strongylocentrotus purpuratus]|uniref:Uridine kinase n=1 Tax=Strongylocentrotus purpuratus TaxID=7668 RepID=A0A7M7NNP3_STRPU|nr:uridine-cytidine kinase-like 1 isoform X1 [Strongylocentrotus purpuratus]XP_030839290.1 uridine-cytidine kinase-like 1 isoform X2 [Strongylocentrotus purpuratus]